MTGYTYSGSDSFLQLLAASDSYGVIEKEKTFEEIYPTWTGIASIVGATDIYSFFDNSVDFDINDYLISGLEAKIHFNTGNLAGYEFTLKRFDSGTGKFVINKITDERGLEIPNSNDAFKIGEGDTFVIVDITLPDEYIALAERKLFNAAKEWLDKHSLPTVIYEAELDRMYLKNHPINRESWFQVGDSIEIQDPVIVEGNEPARIIALKRDLFIPEKFSITFGNNSFRNTISSINKKAKGTAAIIDNTAFKDAFTRRSANSRIRSNDYDGGRING